MPLRTASSRRSGVRRTSGGFVIPLNDFDWKVEREEIRADRQRRDNHLIKHFSSTSSGAFCEESKRRSDKMTKRDSHPTKTERSSRLFIAQIAADLQFLTSFSIRQVRRWNKFNFRRDERMGCGL